MAKLRRAYSLIEMTVALSIAGVIAAAALSTYAALVGSTYALRAQSRLDTQLQRVGRALAADLQEVAGGSIRPWHALYLQPTPGAPDGLLMLTAEARSRPCTVARFEVDHDRLELDAGCSACGASAMASMENEYVGRFAVLSRPVTGESRVVVLRSPDGGCRYDVNRFIESAGVTTADAERWAGASFTVVDAKWIFVDAASHELRAWLLYDGAHAPHFAKTAPLTHRPRGTLASYVVDERVLATSIYDFQVAFGYDVNFDNVVDESAGGAGDEWFGNAPAEVSTTDWVGDSGVEFTSSLVPGAIKDVQQIRLRSAMVGVVMGLGARGRTRDPVAVLDGIGHQADGMIFRATTARAMFRNAGATQ